LRSSSAGELHLFSSQGAGINDDKGETRFEATRWKLSGPALLGCATDGPQRHPACLHASLEFTSMLSTAWLDEQGVLAQRFVEIAFARHDFPP